MKALVTAELTRDGLDALAGLGLDVTTAGWGWTGTPLPPAALRAALDGVAVLVTEIEPVDAAVLDAARDLRLVAAARGAPTNVDLAAATAAGIAVVHTPGRNAASVADFVVGLLLVEARNIARGQDHLRRSGWMVDGELPYRHFRGPELAGRTLGLVGYGAVAREVAVRAAHGFGMRVLAFDPYAKVAPPASPAQLDDLLGACDVLSLHVADTPETRGMIGARELGLLRPGAYVVNTARAACVQEQALLDALRERRIAGAALDVFWSEPLPADHPLLSLDNVTLTPHLAGAADDVVAHHTAMIVEDVARWLAGEPPLRLANPAVR